MVTFIPLVRRSQWWLTAAACGAAVSLYVYTFWRPALMQDDFEILAQSVTWERTWAGLWIPQNEHAMPLGRLLTYALLQLAGRPSNYPLAAALVGPAALVVAMLLTARFVRRELKHPFYSLFALTVFGVSAVYQQAVFWFAASFSVVTLDMLLLGLLAAQSYRRTRHWPYLLLSALYCFLAPCWFASGVLAGPLCCLYLLPLFHDDGDRRDWKALAEDWFRSLYPLAGTLAFVGISLPRTSDAIMNLPHYQMQDTNALDAFQPGKGFLMSLRSLVENLLLGVVGITEVQVPVPLVVVALLGLGIFGVWWWRRAPCKRLLLLGSGLIGANYLLVYSARAEWSADGSLVGVAWSRYHLLPQLGLALFLVGGLPAWNGRLFTLSEDGGLTRNQVRFLACLIGILLLVQLPRSISATIRVEPLPFEFGKSKLVPPDDQQQALHLVERVDARCREQGISAAAAKRVLPWLAIPGATPEGEAGEFNGWELLKGSATPREPETRSDEELRRLLEE